MGKIANIILKGREHDRKTCCSIYLHSHWRERGRERRREMEWKEGERLSERQNVVVKVLFAAEEGGGGD